MFSFDYPSKSEKKLVTVTFKTPYPYPLRFSCAYAFRNATIGLQTYLWSFDIISLIHFNKNLYCVWDQKLEDFDQYLNLSEDFHNKLYLCTSVFAFRTLWITSGFFLELFRFLMKNPLLPCSDFVEKKVNSIITTLYNGTPQNSL